MNRAKVIYFGNPKVRTLLMQEMIEICYDLPLSIAVFEKNSSCCIKYKMPKEVIKEYNIRRLDAVMKMDEFLNNVVSAVSES